MEDRLDRIESKQGKLEERVHSMEVTQGGLVEAVKDVRNSIDKLAGEFTWTTRTFMGLLIIAVVKSLIVDLGLL